MIDIIITKLKQRFIGWETRIKWPNELFPGVDGESYIKVDVYPVDGTFAGVGTTDIVSDGLIRAYIFVPRGTGLATSGRLGKAALDLLKGWHNGGLQCYAGYEYKGPDQPIWLQHNVEIKYKYNQCLEG